MQPDTNHDTTDPLEFWPTDSYKIGSHNENGTWSKSYTPKTSATIPEKSHLGDLDAMIICK